MISTPIRSGRLTTSGWALVLALVYFASAKLGLGLAFSNESVTAVWPPTGIALAALVLGGRGLWPGVLLGAFLANVTTDVPVYTAAGIAVGNTLEAVVGAWLLDRFGFRPALLRLRDIFALVLLAGVLSTAVSATIGIASLSRRRLALRECALSMARLVAGRHGGRPAGGVPDLRALHPLALSRHAGEGGRGARPRSLALVGIGARGLQS